MNNIDYARYEGHTPGPWTVVDDVGDKARVVDCDGYQHVTAEHVAVMYNYRERLGINHWANSDKGSRYIEEEEQFANARLIADAPLILSALRASEAELATLRRELAVRERALELVSVSTSIACPRQRYSEYHPLQITTIPEVCGCNSCKRDGKCWGKLRECDYFKYWRYSAARCTWIGDETETWSVGPGCGTVRSDFTAWAEIIPIGGK